MLAEWHLPPDYILDNWTEELLNLMIDKMAERKRQESGAASTKLQATDTQVVSNDEMFQMLGNRVKVEKND